MPTRRVSFSLTACSPDGSAVTDPRSSRGARRREKTAPSRSASVVAGALVSRAGGGPNVGPQSTQTFSVALRTWPALLARTVARLRPSTVTWATPSSPAVKSRPFAVTVRARGRSSVVVALKSAS